VAVIDSNITVHQNRLPMEIHRRTSIPRSVWALGFVSLFMDISSEMIHSLLPVFLVSVLGASAIHVGIIEGVGEATASITKLFSGWLSDRLGRRKLLTVLGYGLGALSKPLFATASNPSWVLLARFTDRVGKGVRGAPRDALVGDLAPVPLRGAAYGLRQALDTVGAFAGPAVAMFLLVFGWAEIRSIFWLAVVPGVIAVVILVVAVHEPPTSVRQQDGTVPIRFVAPKSFGGPFWGVVLMGSLLTFARFSEAFLILRAEDRGLALAFVPLVLVVMNATYAASAYPAGVLSDRLDRRSVLAIGIAVLIVSEVILAIAPSGLLTLLGVAVWGLHLGLTQGVLLTLIADAVPPRVRGTAFGIYHLITGVTLLASSILAGLLWEWIGPAATFTAGAGFAALALIIVATRRA
jgi:MFS family permease